MSLMGLGTLLQQSGAWETVEHTFPGADANSVTISGLTGDFFRIYVYMPAPVNVQDLALRFNGDSAGNYHANQVNMANAVETRGTDLSATQLVLTRIAVPAAPATFEILIAKPLATEKAYVVSRGCVGISTAFDAEIASGIWNNTSAKITSIEMRGGAGTDFWDASGVPWYRVEQLTI